MTGTLEQQIQLEESSKEEAIQAFISKNTKEGVIQHTAHGEILIKLAFDPFKKKIDEYFKADLRTQSLKTRQFLQLMSEDSSVIAYTVLMNVLHLSNAPLTVTNMSSQLVYRLMDLNFFDNIRKRDPKFFNYLGKEYKDAGASRKRQLIKKHSQNLGYEFVRESKRTEIIRLGTTLLSLLINSGAGIVEVVTQKRSRKHPIKIVRLTDEAQQILVDVFYRKLNFSVSPKYLPMVYPPKDWGNGTTGGYYTQKTLMFTGGKTITKKFQRTQDYSLAYPVINKAQKVPWRINKRVLDVMHDVFFGNLVDHGNPAKLPKLYGGLPTSNVYKAEDLISRDSYEDWKSYTRDLDALQIQLDGERGRRLQLLHALDVADKVVDYDSIYFPYQFDYRGRLYPNTTHLNPQSPKHIKSLLEFSNGKLLNQEGVKWLKIHLANTYGLDKESFESRIKWAEAHHSILLAIASDPLDFIKDWAYSDSPYEFLSACFAYKDYTEGKEVHTPIQLDATCSGVQFYSGLLLDKEGARNVNVIGTEREDVYQRVADKVNEYLETGEYPDKIEFRDSEGDERIVTTAVEAASLKGNITRSLVKRNVMTIPYSVSMRGMSDQLWDEMEELERKGKAFWKGDRWVVNKLLTYLNHKAAYTVLKGAKLGQDYLTAVAGLIKEPAVWKTPLYNFAILQPAIKETETKVSTVFGRLTLYLESPKFAAGKQRQGIAPNVIHSLDAELLRYVIDNFEGDIGTTHDCFMVHPNEGEQVRDLYKQGFVLLMGMNPLRYIGQQIDKDGSIDVPCIGDLDLKEVYNSMYIIS